MRTFSSEEGKPRESRSKRFMAWKSRWVWYVLSLGTLIVLLTGIAFWWFTRGRSQSQTGDGDALIQPLNPRLVEKGRGVYEANCAQCHGARAEGQPNWRQQNADSTYPPPPHDSTGHTWHHSDGLLYRIVRDGGSIYETPGFKSAMPALGDRLSPEEMRAVISYLKSLWGPKERSFQAQVSLEDPFP